MCYPTAHSGAKRRIEGSSAQGVKSAVDVGLGLKDGLKTEFVTELSLMGMVSTGEKSK